jgi:radical SAM superfamily enzyme YgiQ (UPF0313 family)
MKNFESIFEQFSHKLPQNGIYYSGKEFNTLDAEDFFNSDLKVLICRLSTYRDTSQSFTHPLLYRLITGIHGAFADMCYLPPLSDLELFRKNNIPLLLPVKTKVETAEFDVIAVSNSLVQEFLNIETLLRESGIETDHSTRILMEDQPLIVLGGSNSANSHFLMHERSPVDIVYTGDDPEDIVRFFSKIKELKRSGSKKSVITAELFKEFPVVTPLSGESGVKSTISVNYKEMIQPSGVPLLFKDDPDSANIVISRGCQWFCSFCNESFRTKPYSEIMKDDVIKTGSELKKLNGSSEAGIFSFNFNAHSGIEEIIGELHKNFRIVSLKSQRFDVLSIRSEFLKLLQFAGKTSITCGLEGISERLRNYLSKDLDKNELEQSLSSILKSPVRTLKIFLIGTGLENEEDYKELNELLEFIKFQLQSRPRPPRIVFSLTPLVRFPGTPIGYERAYNIGIMQNIIERVSKMIVSAGFEFRKAGSVYEYFVSQILLRNGSAEFYDAVQKTVNETCSLYYDSIDKKFYDRLCSNLKELDPDTDAFLNNNLNYSHFNSNIKKEFFSLAQERSKKFEGISTCSRIKNLNSKCNSCGACITNDQREAVMEFKRGKNLSVEELKKNQADFNSGVDLEMPVFLSDKCCGLSDKYLGAVFSSALYRTLGSGSDHVKRFLSFKNRSRFENEEIQGRDTVIFSCDPDHADVIKSIIQTDKFMVDFEKNAQGFGHIISKTEYKIIISVPSDKKIDNSFISKFHIKSTVIRIGEGIYEAQVSKDGLKKKQFSKVLINIPEGRIEIFYGEKFDLNLFLTTLCDFYKFKQSSLNIKLK